MKNKNLSFASKKGFTLAEVLIVLGIIGVVAALTIPALLNKYNKDQIAVKLQRATSELNQAYKLATSQNGELSTADMVNWEPVDIYNTYWKPYFKVSKFCNDFKSCGYKSNTPFITRQKTNTGTMIVPSANFTFETTNGFTYFVQTRGNATPPHIESFGLYFDINGSKGPNMLGTDIFIFSFAPNSTESILPICSGRTDEEVNQNCKESDGGCCAEKIRRDGWKIGKDYPF